MFSATQLSPTIEHSKDPMTCCDHGFVEGFMKGKKNYKWKDKEDKSESLLDFGNAMT